MTWSAPKTTPTSTLVCFSSRCASRGLLQQVGIVGIKQRPFLLDASCGSPLYASSLREFEVTYALLQPFLTGSGVVDASTYDHCYRWMLAETRQDDFRCLAFGVSVWGSKPPEELLDEGTKQIV